MKETFENAEIKVVSFDPADVIVTSGCGCEYEIV